MNRFTKIVSLATTGTFLLFNTAALADSSSADLVANALIHGDRPAEEAADDARRMPLEVLAFAGIREGMAVLELEAGGGYYTEILSRAVGPAGSVIVQNPPSFASFVGDQPQTRIAGNRLPNVRNTSTNFDELDVPDNSIDMVTWILGPHELWFEPAENVSLGDPADSFAEIARVLKPGGVLLAVDHIAPASSGPEVGGTLHRISEDIVTDLAAAAGLEVVRVSQLHKNADDPLDIGVFDPAIAGNTSKFVVLYRK
jgi:predicted methyltransferase